MRRPSLFGCGAPLLLLLSHAILCPLVVSSPVTEGAAGPTEERQPSSVSVPTLNSGQEASASPTKTTNVDEVPVTPPYLVDKSEARDFGLSLVAIVTIAAVLLLPIVVIFLIGLFVPLPALYLPLGTLPGVNNGVLVTGKNLKSELYNKLAASAERMRGIESDKCIQRISCEILRASKGIKMDKWIYRLLNEMPVGYDFKQKIVRAAQPARNCQAFTCSSITSIMKIFS